MEEQLISFETAKSAYQKGFNLPFKGYYIPMYTVDGEVMKEKLGYQKELPEVFDKGFIIAPTQSLLQKWLRDIHNIHIEIQYSFDFNKYMFLTHSAKGGRIVAELFFLQKDSEEYLKYSTHEEALEAGLIEALNLIKS